MPIYSNYSGVQNTNMRRIKGRRKYFTPAATRGDWKDISSIGWNRNKRQNHRDNAANLDIQYYESITRPLSMTNNTIWHRGEPLYHDIPPQTVLYVGQGEG